MHFAIFGERLCDVLKKRKHSCLNFVAGRGEGKRRNKFAEWHVAWLAE